MTIGDFLSDSDNDDDDDDDDNNDGDDNKDKDNNNKDNHEDNHKDNQEDNHNDNWEDNHIYRKTWKKHKKSVVLLLFFMSGSDQLPGFWNSVKCTLSKITEILKVRRFFFVNLVEYTNGI